MKNKLAVDTMSPEDFFDEGGADIMETMMDVIKFQQQGAIDLTKLVLEHCKEEEITKAYVFEVSEEAMSVVKAQLDEDYQ